MRLSSMFIMAATFAAAGAAAFVGAGFAVKTIEDTTAIAVRDALDTRNLIWAEVETDGLQVLLSGTAPTEAMRFKALSTAGGIVDAARIIDDMNITASEGIAPPQFSIEILRNDSGISLIGLIPADADRENLLTRLRKIGGENGVADLLEVADYDVPSGWDAAVDYAIKALKILPRAKISLTSDRIAITAISDSPEARRKLESELSRATPTGVKLELAISAPRPVVTPFTLRFVRDSDGVRFDACSADTEEARERIIAAGVAAGIDDKISCTLALGVPSPTWATAAEHAIAAVAELGEGSVTFADADITIVAAENTDQSLFDRVIGELENRLPEVFALHPVLPVTEEKPSAGPPEFIATLSPEGLVQLRGRLSTSQTRAAADTYARARFGSDIVRTTARLDDALPEGWPVRVLAGIEALSRLNHGAVTVTPDLVTVSGVTGNPDANADISGLLAEKLGDSGRFEIDVEYKRQLDPVAGVPTPEECEEKIDEILVSRKINFEPGSDTIDADGRVIMDDIARILKRCGEIRMEIGGHTDSQGREEMNQQLSQARAQAVLNELRNRKVLTSSFVAKGYGEATPIADNKTEDGREANRRIEFRLIRPAPIPETVTTLESLAPVLPASGDDVDATSIDPDASEPDEGSGDAASDAGADDPSEIK